MSRRLTGAAVVAGVVGSPVRHSLSPLLHGAWIEAAGLDAAYVPFSPPEQGFRALVEGFRGGVVVGVNVTLPFKEEALALADVADGLSTAAGAANLLLFHPDGAIEARNTDGPGLLAAFAEQAADFDLTRKPVLILGAGGAARGAVAALLQAGVPEVRVINRTEARASALAAAFRDTRAFDWAATETALSDVGAVINATSGGLSGQGALAFSFAGAPSDAVAMDMVYKPILTPFLASAREHGCRTVDGLAMLIGQAAPSFEALYGRPPPMAAPVRAIALEALGEG
jgi:shikimate dehydrogenase